MSSNIREYGEGYEVSILPQENGRLCIVAWNEGGHNSTLVDLLDVINFVKEELPELLKGE